MTISLSGPQGYEYQYLVTAYLAISLIDDESLQLFIEKSGGEDAEINIEKDGVRRTLEVQVKRFSGDLSLDVATSWLCHFASQKSDDNLLFRLMSDSARSALFVTDSRCLDETKAFIHNFSFNTHDKSPLKRTLFDHVIDILEQMDLSDTDLGKKRSEFCKKLAQDLRGDKSFFEDVLKRVTIWEQIKDGEIETRLYSILNKKYLVPQSQCNELLLKILQAVRNARDKQENIIPSIIDLITGFKGNRIFVSTINVARRNIAELISQLEKDKVLLLTGSSFCGKTHTAKFIAQEFQDRGFTCSQGNNIEDASRFLTFSGTEDRLFLLGDPFGSVELKEESSHIWHGLNDLIHSIPSHRLLIVTSRRDLLRTLKRTANIAEWKIYGYNWYDLTVRDRKFLIAMWEMFCEEKQLSSATRGLVSTYLKTAPEDDLLQPGHLRHLSHREADELANKTMAEIFHIARADAEELGNFLNDRNSNCRQLLMALALSSTTIEPVYMKELAFILSETEDTPSFLLGVFRVLSNKDMVKPHFPQYTRQDNLSTEYEEELDYLEKHGYISRKLDTIYFTHPTYEEAAKYVLLKQTLGNLKRLKSIYIRTLACLETQTALNAALRLDFLFSKYSDSKDFRRFLVSSAIGGFNSIFPSVQDNCLFFLLKVMHFLTPKEREDVLTYLRGSDINNEAVLWHKGSPWIDPSPEKSLWSSLKWQLKSTDKTEVSQLISRFLNPDTAGTISPEEAWDIAVYLKQGDIARCDKLTILTRLMSLNDSFIRAAASFQIMLNYEEGREDLLDLVFQDNHPRVILQDICGAFCRWKDYSSETRTQIFCRLKASLANPFVAVVSGPFFLDFADEHGAHGVHWSEYVSNEDKNMIWQLWADVFPIWFDVLPPDVPFNEAHLYNTAIESIGHIRSEQGNQIAAAWLSWIEKSLKITLPHDYGLSVVDFLLKVTGHNASVRKELVKSLLTQEDTNFITVNLASLIDEWSVLDANEKDMILELLRSDRKDVRWLRAVALTRAQVPAEIIHLLLGQESALTLPTEELLMKFPEGMLSDCLSIYCGHPQPLWWLGYHHATDEPWLNILKSLLGKSHYSCFNIALREMLAWADYEKWADSLTYWQGLCGTADLELRQLIFRKLLQWTSSNNRSYRHYWAALFDSMSDAEEYNSAVSRVVEFIEAVERFNPKGELFELFGNGRFNRDFLPKLTSDSLALRLLGMRSHFAEMGLFEEIVEILQSLYQKTSPRLVLTHDLVIEWAKEIGVQESSEIIRLVKDVRSQTFERGSKEHTLFDDHYELEDWVSLRREI